GRRGHPPFRAVDRRAELPQLVGELEALRRADVAEIGGAPDAQAGAVVPAVGVADLHRERRELLQSRLLRRRTQPVELADAVGERGAQVLDHLAQPRLRLGREDALDVQPPERLADRTAAVVDDLDDALPAWLFLLLSEEAPAKEVEVLVGEGLREVGRPGTQDVPA